MTRRFLAIATAFLVAAGLASRVDAASLIVAWNPSAGATGYIVHWGTQSGSHPNQIDVGSGTSHQFTALTPGTRYNFTIAAYNEAGTSPETPEVSARPVAIDLNHDDRPDVLWENQVTGQIGVWFMDGTSQASAAMLGAVAPAWKAVAFADFDRDGSTDILWRNNLTGQLVVWFMDGASVINTAFLSPSAVSDLKWKIVAVADFNLDGYPDLLWRNDVMETSASGSCRRRRSFRTRC